MQGTYIYCYCHHHLGFMGKEEVGSRLLMLERSKHKQAEQRGEFWTIQFPAHTEIR